MWQQIQGVSQSLKESEILASRIRGLKLRTKNIRDLKNFDTSEKKCSRRAYSFKSDHPLREDCLNKGPMFELSSLNGSFGWHH